jgi:pectinesterase
LIGPLQWIRNPSGNHGHVFKECTIIGLDEPLPWTVTDANPAGDKPAAVLARLPNNNGTNYPYAEFVLIDTRMSGIVPEGVVSIESQTTFDWSNVRFWEHNTMNIDGTPLDLSMRHPIMRELKTPEDAALIQDYSNPAFVLGGWTPVVDPG